MNIHYHKTLQYYMESDQHILGHSDSGSASCLHTFADKTLEETVYLWYKYYKEAKIQ